jgi:hypothetical protein
VHLCFEGAPVLDPRLEQDAEARRPRATEAALYARGQETPLHPGINAPLFHVAEMARYIFCDQNGLDSCTRPSIADGVLRERRWTVPLKERSAVHIEETDFPRNRRLPIPRDILGLPHATSVFGAKN